VLYIEAENLGVHLVALGNDKVLSMNGATQINQKMRALGFEVFDPDRSMFTLGAMGCIVWRRPYAEIVPRANYSVTVKSCTPSG
jgi:N-dimethylarginine dimethylaminohydrolase